MLSLKGKCLISFWYLTASQASLNLFDQVD